MTADQDAQLLALLERIAIALENANPRVARTIETLAVIKAETEAAAAAAAAAAAPTEGQLG